MPDSREASTALGEWLGAHALPAFGVALGLVSFAAVVVWYVGRRHLWPPAEGTEPSPIRLALRLAAGFAIIVAASFAFAEIAEEVGDGGGIGRFDEALSLAIDRTVGEAVLRTFAVLTRLGDPLTLTLSCIVVAIVLVLRGRRALAFAWVVALAGNGLLNMALKQVFARARPLHELGIVQEQGWSFPSGHSSGAVVAYGMLAYLLIRGVPARWHLPIVVLAAATAFAVGSSRIFLRVHFASDVIAGFLSGSAWLATCVLSVELARHYRRR